MTESLSRDPSFDESLEAVINAELAEVHTALPAKVVKYADGKADVKPVILRVYEAEDGTEQTVAYPVITNVPVMNLRGGGAFISIPLKAGDPVWLLFAQRSLDKYLETDGTQDLDTEDARRHHLSDAICYPGGGTWRNAIPNAHADDLVIGLEDGKVELHITPGGEVCIKAEAVRMGSLSAAEALAKASVVDARLDALESHASGHTHGNGNFGSPTTSAVIPLIPGGGSTASSTVFADA
jgi:hypothetical protein